MSAKLPLAAVVLVVLLGAALRLAALDAMEFKGDERESLLLAQQFIAERPWATDHAFPVYGLISSNGVGNAPLFTWIVAGFWAIAPSPVGVTRIIALLNVLTFFPLWCWARRRMSDWRAVMTVAVVAFSPFYVLYSRKIWAPDLMLASLLTVLWAIEWWRDGRPWRALALVLVATLVVGQLHQSGPIALLLLPIAAGVQWLVDRRSGHDYRWPRPTAGEIVALVFLVAINLFFWLPYLNYFFSLPAETFARRKLVEDWTPELLRKAALQVVPTDIFYFFDPHRYAFLDGVWRSRSYAWAVNTGWVLLAYGAWRWIRRPHTLPVVGVWWLMIVAVFAAARILTQPYYVLILAPLTAVLPAGGFDPPRPNRFIDSALATVRLAHALSLLVLSATLLAWLAGRQGAAGEYGVAYATREVQARQLAAGLPSPEARNPELACGDMPIEVQWLAQWRAKGRSADARLQMCDGWVLERGELVYRWQLRPASN